MHQVVIVGAGPAGIATALSLHDRGVNALLVDRGDRVGWSWSNRYDRLRLNTGRQFSHLPGRPYPKGTPTYPTRDQVVAHLERHVRDAGIALRLGTEVQRIDRHGGGWRLTTSTGDIDGATGRRCDGIRAHPERSGLARDATASPASSCIRRRTAIPSRYVGKRVLVVGAGSSGLEIAHDLATGGAAKVWLSIRTPPEPHAAAGPGGSSRRCHRVPALPRARPPRRRDHAPRPASRASGT